MLISASVLARGEGTAAPAPRLVSTIQKERERSPKKGAQPREREHSQGKGSAAKEKETQPKEKEHS